MPGTDPSHSPDRAALPGAGRTAVVTGASSGIGAATAARLAADGFDVVLGARRLDRLEALAASIGARALPLDVTDQASVAAFAGALDRVDVLVNNAGGSFDAKPGRRGGPGVVGPDLRRQRAGHRPADEGPAAGAARLRRR